MRAFILETRRELDDLAAGCTDGDGYVEALTIGEPVSLEVEGLPGVNAP